MRKDVLSWGIQNEVLPVSAGVVPTLEPSILWDGIESVPPYYASHGPDKQKLLMEADLRSVLTLLIMHSP